MPRPPDPDRLEAFKEIRNCIIKHGPDKGPSYARQKFPDVPSATWYRWVETTRDEDRNLVEEIVASVPQIGHQPATLAEGDRKAMRRAIDFYSEFDAMVADAQLLASYAVATNDDGTRRVKNPPMLAISHRMRAANLTLAMKHTEMVWSVERIEEMYTAILDSIMQVDPETGQLAFAAVENVMRRWNLLRDA